MITEIAYTTFDNKIGLILKEDSTAIDASQVTRIVLNVAGSDYDSNVNSEFFNWPTSTTGEIELLLGDAGIPAEIYKTHLITYDANNTDGIVWGSFWLDAQTLP